MSKIFDFSDFDKKNKNRTKAFEDMCRTLFLRDREKSSYDYSYNYNEAGLEFKPVLDEKENKWYGIQCKYFITSNGTKKYDEIYKSIETAIKCFKGTLNVIYIYTNSDLKPICTDEEINSKAKSSRIRIARVSKKNNIEIKWFQADNILDMMRTSNNLDLYNMYFSDSREVELVKDTISIEENTFLQSNQFMNLRFKNGDTLNSLESNIIESKCGLILGAAGTGKSVGMKKLYKGFYDRFNEARWGENKDKESICIPIFIRLRECVNGNLEDLVRERLKDYALNYTGKENNYIYLLDGLDEVSYHDVSRVVCFIKFLHMKEKVKGIVISSRMDSNNLSYVRQKFKWKEYCFDKLEYEDIENYFKSKNNKSKYERFKNGDYKKLIKDIDDIFSVKILWENIEKVDSSTSKIEIIELSIVYWISNYSKLNELALLEPKQEKICCICQEISLLMQEKATYSIALDEVQRLIKHKFDISSPKEINAIIEALTELFFESNYNCGLGYKMTFKHKRFQEFFLYQKIEKEYYNKPEILRELQLLSNQDFMVNIFLRTSLSRAQKSKNMYKFLALRLLEGYLDQNYIYKNKDELIGRNQLFLNSESFNAYSKAFLYLLATYKEKELDILIDNENLNIRDAITNKNFAEFVEIYHRTNGKDISFFVMEKFKLKANYKNNIDKVCYYSYNIKNKSIDEIHEFFLSKSVLNDDKVKDMDFVAYDEKLYSSFIKVALEFELEYLTDLIDSMDKFMLEVLSYNLMKYRYINILMEEEQDFQDFRKKFISRVVGKDEDYYTNTLAIYTFLSKEDKYDDKLSKAFEKINKDDFSIWNKHIELHIFLAIFKKGKVNYNLNGSKLGVDIVQVIYANYKNKNKILEKWIEVIKPYNFIHSNYLKYKYSFILGVLISKIKLDVLEIKSFFRELLNYESVIYIQTVLFTIYEYNKKLFEKVVNKGLLDKVLQDTIEDNIDEYYDLSYSIFQLAVMYDSIDVDKKHELLITGIDNGIVRPHYSAKNLAGIALPECLYLAYESYWYDKNNLENKSYQLYNILQIMNKTTDRGVIMNYFKWVVENIGLDSENLSGKLNEFSVRPLHGYAEIFDYDMTLINIDNIEKYYACKIEHVPYNSIQFWKDLIKIEYETDKNLSKLYATFKEENYPSGFEENFVYYCHFPTAVLFEKEDTKEKIVKFIFEQGGMNGMYNMIRVFFIRGDMKSGVDYIEYLFKFCDLLIGKSSGIVYENNVNDIDKYIRGNWKIAEHQNEKISELNPNVKIICDNYDEGEQYRENWATQHIDKSAYKYNYKFFEEGILIKKFSLVCVDGGRAILPIPKLNTNIVKRDEYFLSRIFNSNKEELNSYMRRSGLIVE